MKARRALIALAMVLLAGGCLVAISIQEPGPPSSARLRPLPPDVNVVSETDGCSEVPSSHRICSRTLILSKAGTSGTDLKALVTEWYRQHGQQIEGLTNMTWSSLSVEVQPDSSVEVTLLDEHIK